MANEHLEKGLLIKSLRTPYIAKSVLSKDIGALFNDEKNVWIAQQIYMYYTFNDVLLDEETLKEKIKKKVNTENRKNTKLGKEELSDEFTLGLIKRIDELYTTPDNDNPSYLADLEAYIKNNLTTKAILEESVNNDDTLASRVEKRIDDIKDISLVANNEESINIVSDIDKRTQLYEEGFTQDTVYTGLKSLDTVTGGLGKKSVACIAASSGSFKTGSLVNLAYHYTLKGYNVLYIALEGRASDMLLRFDKLFLNVSNNQVFNKGKVTPQYIKYQQELYKKAMEKHKENPLNLVFRQEVPNSLTLDDMENILIDEERRRGIKFDVLIVDYADLLKKRRADNESAVGEELFQGLSKIAGLHNVLLWTGSQLNRSAGVADVKTVDNVEGSYRKINICEFWATINTSKEEREAGYMRWHIDKLRNLYGNYSDDFIYWKLDQKNYKLLDETQQQHEEHVELIEGGKKQSAELKQKVKKERQEDMLDKFNKMLGDE